MTSDLTNPFAPADEAAWRALVDKALKGGDFEKRLFSRTADGLPIAPLYTRGQSEAIDSGAAGAAPYTRGRHAVPEGLGWDIRMLHAGADPGAVNAAILDDLAGGANSVTLSIAAPGLTGLPARRDAIAEALTGVHLEFAPVALSAGDQYIGAAASMADIWDERGVAGANRRAAINADPLGHLARTGVLEDHIGAAVDVAGHFAAGRIGENPNVTLLLADGRPYHDAGASEAQELAAMLATLVEYLRALDELQVRTDKALPVIAVALSADADMFPTIAKIRAARRLVWRIAEACGHGNAARAINWQIETSARMMSRRDPHVNMLRTTIACAAAALAGADAITVLPYTHRLGLPDAFARRMARNTQIILQEESHLGRVVDPSGGSHFVEALSDAMARRAWDLFQEIERRGGMVHVLPDGWLHEQIGAVAEARGRDIASGKHVLTGVSAFPDLDEKPVAVQPFPAPAPFERTETRIAPLNLRPLGGAFEDLREASDRHLAGHGLRPRVFLANLGALSDFNVRATFARNFFGAGGVEAVGSDGFASPEGLVSAFADSGASIACVCSSDAIYGERAAAAVAALKAAGATRVYLAGRPGDLAMDLEAAGLDGAIHAGCDMIGVLNQLHAELGVLGKT